MVPIACMCNAHTYLIHKSLAYHISLKHCSFALYCHHIWIWCSLLACMVVDVHKEYTVSSVIANHNARTNTRLLWTILGGTAYTGEVIIDQNFCHDKLCKIPTGVCELVGVGRWLPNSENAVAINLLTHYTSPYSSAGPIACLLWPNRYPAHGSVLATFTLCSAVEHFVRTASASHLPLIFATHTRTHTHYPPRTARTHCTYTLTRAQLNRCCVYAEPLLSVVCALSVHGYPTQRSEVIALSIRAVRFHTHGEPFRFHSNCSHFLVIVIVATVLFSSKAVWYSEHALSEVVNFVFVSIPFRARPTA